MRHWRVVQSLAQVIGICAQRRPDAEQNWQGGNNSRSEYNCYNLRGRLWVIAKDVADLRLSGKTEGGLGNAQRDIGVAGYVQVEDLALVRSRGAE